MQEPLDFRRECLSHSFSLLMPAFALLRPPAALTGPPSQANRTLRYRDQGSVIRTGPPLCIEALRHARDLAILVSPAFACALINVFQIRAVFQPDLHLVGRTNRHHQIAFEFSVRPPL